MDPPNGDFRLHLIADRRLPTLFFSASMLTSMVTNRRGHPGGSPLNPLTARKVPTKTWFLLGGDESGSLARIMHKFSTAAAKSSVLTALHSVVLLNVPYSTFAGTSVARGAAHSGRPFRRFVTSRCEKCGLVPAGADESGSLDQ